MSFKMVCATILGLSAAASAHAGTIVVTSGGASATVTAISAMGTAAPFSLLDLGSAGTNGFVSAAPVTFSNGAISFTGTSAPASGVYDGYVTNVAFSPYFNTTLSNANYLVAEPGGSVIVNYTSPQSILSLLWGSVDGYDNLNVEFLNGTSVVGSINLNGNQIAAADSMKSDGSSSAYVTITPGGSLTSFNTIIATASSRAFEFNIGTGSANTAVPEPATLALLATGLVGVALRRSRKI